MSLQLDCTVLVVAPSFAVQLMPLSVTQSIERQMIRLMNDELTRLWKEAVMAYFKELYEHLPGGTKENLNQDSSCPGQNGHLPNTRQKHNCQSQLAQYHCSIVLLIIHLYAKGAKNL
jgi:hypothetical protein